MNAVLSKDWSSERGFCPICQNVIDYSQDCSKFTKTMSTYVYVREEYVDINTSCNKSNVKTGDQLKNNENKDTAKNRKDEKIK